MNGTGREAAVLGGGCFWCLEAAYQLIDGVESVESGYAGGTVSDPSYAEVCSGRTGHAEVVRLTFDPDVVTFRDLLQIFFTIHDPTTLNRQGADVGTQYRSVIFPRGEAQRRAAEEVIEELRASGTWPDPIVTEIAPDAPFYPAEAYHQGYYRRNPDQPYCQAVIAPKVAKLRREGFDRLRRRDGSGAQEDVAGVRPYQEQPSNPVDHGGIAE
jgi:peptide-methionine (S)-S-oxide reductase